MKNILTKIVLILAFVFGITCSKAQGIWTQKASVPATKRFYPTWFSIGHYAFVGCGYDGSYFKDFYKWNQTTNSWSSITSYPGNGSLGCSGFAIEGKGYVCFGSSISSRSTDLWRYDTATNLWQQMASLPGVARYDQDCFVLGHKAYIICGSQGGPPYLNEVWVYDAHTNTWTQLNNFPGGQLEGVVTFSIGNRGYAGGGWDGGSYHTAFWQYDSTNDSWTSIASIPVPAGVSDGPAAFVIGSKAYVCVGGYSHVLPDGYAYDTNTKAWTVFTNMGTNKIERGWAAALSIGNYGYICMGQDSNGAYLNDLWQYYPDSVVPVECNTWTQKASVPATKRFYPAWFSTGHYAFVGCGNDGIYDKDFYKWNQTNNSWSSIASYPGNGSLGCSGFAIEGKGYVGLGENASSRSTDLWRYDTATNLWQQMASLPGSARYDQDCFVLGHKAYIICGSLGGPPYINEVWVYDAHANTWTQLNNFPGGQLEGVVTFTIGNRGYAGGGWDGAICHTAFWQYDSTNDTWTSIASIPVPTGVSDGPAAFVLGSKAYVCVGGYASHVLPDGYVYDTNTKAWTVFTNMGANKIERGWAAALSIGNYGYICMGQDSNGNYLNDLWQYYPCSDTIPLAVNKTSNNNNINVNLYPNPSSGLIHFTYGGVEKQNAEFEVMDITGRVILSQKINLSPLGSTIDGSSLADGMYLYKVTTSDDAPISAGKFIILK